MRTKLDTSPRHLAQELLGRPFDELEPEEQHVLERVGRVEFELDPDELAAGSTGFGERMADAVARIGGSWSFIGIFTLILVAWMLINGPLASATGIQWDAYPYIFLNLMLSTVAALQAPVIMMSQNRHARKDHIASRHDYEVNLRTTIEILRLHRKVDRLFNKLGQIQGSVEGAAMANEAAVEVALHADPLNDGPPKS